MFISSETVRHVAPVTKSGTKDQRRFEEEGVKARPVRLPPLTCHEEVLSYTEPLCELRVVLGCRDGTVLRLGDAEP